MEKPESIVGASAEAARARRPAWFQRIARAGVLSRLSQITKDRLVFDDHGERIVCGQSAEQAELSATVTVRDPSFFVDLALGGSLGGAESYIAGNWTADDLTTVMRIMVRNADIMWSMEGGLARLSGPLLRLAHYSRRNSRDGSRRNIAAHYDLGNEFFNLVLDRSMMYSCAVFEHPAATLDEAARAKVDRTCRKLQLSPADHLLEIGTGWGGFAIHAAKHYGCRVTTATISRQQHEYASRRVAAEGLSGRVNVVMSDYRDLTGQFDKLVSIEMIEAVGHQFLDAYFAKCSELLKSDGMFLLQAITVADRGYERALRTIDFIKRYVFPGSFIPSVTAMLDSTTRSSDLRLFHLEDITPHYAQTLRCWRERTLANLEKVRALGYPDSFLRLWEFYLCYCEGGFRERYIGDVQMLLVKPGCRRDPIAPLL